MVASRAGLPFDSRSFQVTGEQPTLHKAAMILSWSSELARPLPPAAMATQSTTLAIILQREQEATAEVYQMKVGTEPHLNLMEGRQEQTSTEKKSETQ